MNSTLRRACLPLALLLSAACSGGGGGGGGGTTNPPTTGSISGQVSSSAGGAVAGAGVALSGGAATTTGAGGTFSFTGLNPGSYTLTVTPPAGFTLGTEVAAKTVQVQAGQTASVAWALAAPPVSGGLQEVRLGAASFNPDAVTIGVGGRVRWINDLAVQHTITPNNVSQAGAWASQQIGTAGQTFEHTFSTAGTYNYHCGLHAGMTARVVVQ